MAPVQLKSSLSRACLGALTATVLLLAPLSWSQEIAEQNVPAPEVLKHHYETDQLPGEKPRSDEEGVPTGAGDAGADDAASQVSPT